MVLLIGGVKLDQAPRDSNSLYLLAPSLKDKATQFKTISPTAIGPIGLLYVSQREFAICTTNDENISVLGTDDCTTCMAVILRHPSSGVVGLGHFENICIQGLTKMLNRIQEISQDLGCQDQSPIQMHIAGSYSDERNYSENLIAAFLDYAHKQPIEIELMSAFVGELNTIMRGDIPWPIIYGVGVNLKTGEIFPATFPDKGPDVPLRHARLYSGSDELLEIYDRRLGLLKIGPFQYKPMRYASAFLQQSDEFILQHLSTSPEVEPPDFVNQTKRTLRHLVEHPFPQITIFPDNLPRYYKKDESGDWISKKQNDNKLQPT